GADHDHRGADHDHRGADHDHRGADHDHDFRTPAHDDDRGADDHHDNRSVHDHHDLDHVDHVDHDDHHAADVRVHRPGPTDRGGVPANGRRGPDDPRHGLHEPVPRAPPGLGLRLRPGR